MLIRPFQLSDADAVVALWDRCGLIRAWNDPRKDIRRKLAVHPDLFLVGEAAGAIVGSVMAGYDGHRGWINYLGVDPAFRRRGLGRALMREAERRLREAGCPKINLQVRTGNAEAIVFYNSIGFIQDNVVSLGKRLEQDDEISE
jgi:ribosomal protein S18 acetylase RimI-like enzyme